MPVSFTGHTVQCHWLLLPDSSLCVLLLPSCERTRGVCVAWMEWRALSCLLSVHQRSYTCRRKEIEQNCVGETPNPTQLPWAGIKGQGVKCGGGIAEEPKH